MIVSGYVQLAIWIVAIALWIGVYFQMKRIKPKLRLWILRLVTLFGGCFGLVMGVGLSLPVKSVGYEPIPGLTFHSRDHATWWTVFWLVSLTSLTLAGIFHVKYRRLKRAGHCEFCGYNLHLITSGRCPECGADA
jgi:hypothetical protein